MEEEEKLQKHVWRCLKSATHLDALAKLALLRHFLDAFSRLGDIESQLVLRYEILSLCDSNCAADPKIRVGVKDWISFAEDCLQAGFLSNASKAYERVITHIRIGKSISPEQAHVVWKLSKHLNLGMRADTMAEIPIQHWSDNSSETWCGRKGTTVSRFMVGLRKKEMAKLQMLRASNRQW